MSEPLSAVVVAAGRSQRMGFDKLLTPLGGRPLLLHTLERLLRTQVPSEIVLVIRPGSEAEMEAVIAPLRDQGSIRLVPGGAQRQDSVQAGLRAISDSSDFVLVHDAARPFVTKELIDVLLRKAYESALASGATFTDDTAVVEKMGHPVRTVLYHGINFKVTTPADWKLAEAYIQLGEPDFGPGQTLRKNLHDMNNHLTPLLGYAYLLLNEFPEDTRPRKFAKSIQMAAERCQATTASMQKFVRELFPRKGE